MKWCFGDSTVTCSSNAINLAITPLDYIYVIACLGKDDNFRYPNRSSEISIMKYNSSGKFINTLGSKGNGDGQFKGPSSVAIDSEGNMYIADSSNYRIQKFDIYEKFITKWGSKGTEVGQFIIPRGIAVDLEGNIYVADSGNYRIQKFSPKP